VVSRQVEHDIHPGRGLLEHGGVTQVAEDELNPACIEMMLEIGLATAGEIVDNADSGSSVDQGIDKVGANERGTARHQHSGLRPHHRVTSGTKIPQSGEWGKAGLGRIVWRRDRGP
jgi:hypothetical protein